ncbi:7410_t:CDS:1, partial [Gigaspora rosea]
HLQRTLYPLREHREVESWKPRLLRCTFPKSLTSLKSLKKSSNKRDTEFSNRPNSGS